MQCGLCLSDQLTLYFTDSKRSWDYFECQCCDLLFRDPNTYLISSNEKKRYETHNNSIENEGYVRFLTPVVDTLMPHLNPGDQGLDFGSGPGPILDILLQRKGFKADNYDPYFADNKQMLEKAYDFVTCTEVFEHLYQPHKEMEILSQLVKPNGFLVLMTELRKDKERFIQWGYRTDITHVCFLNLKSLGWICERWGFQFLSVTNRIALLQKKET